LVTAAIGIVGATVGGFIGRLPGMYRAGEGAGYVMATLGAVVVLFRQIGIRA
jgi:uncharacterized membrane protein YeaQ/YmgE (transglycosylase-associated protein family)